MIQTELTTFMLKNRKKCYFSRMKIIKTKFKIKKYDTVFGMRRHSNDITIKVLDSLVVRRLDYNNFELWTWCSGPNSPKNLFELPHRKRLSKSVLFTKRWSKSMTVLTHSNAIIYVIHIKQQCELWL